MDNLEAACSKFGIDCDLFRRVGRKKIENYFFLGIHIKFGSLLGLVSIGCLLQSLPSTLLKQVNFTFKYKDMAYRQNNSSIEYEHTIFSVFFFFSITSYRCRNYVTNLSSGKVQNILLNDGEKIFYFQ